jgi:hypothetical protein
MTSKEKTRSYIYGLILFLITLSGFGQMPIFSRYYIASIPGLGWLGEFYITHILHYASAIGLIFLAVYILFDFVIQGAGLNRITGSGYLKMGIIAGLIISGGLMVVKNLPGIYWDHTAVIVLDLTHLGFCMALLMVSLYTLILKKTWVK